jgi:hypothetical protein
VQNKHELDARTQAELEAARKDREEARREAEKAKRDAEAKVQDAEARLRSEFENLRAERDLAKRDLDESPAAAQLELEKDRVAQFKVELDELRADLERTRSERETLREELALQQKIAAGETPKREPPVQQPSRAEREQQMTVPIPDRAPANEVTAPITAAEPKPQRTRQREGTAYSVTHVEEEQVFVRKGGGGGRGNR